MPVSGSWIYSIFRSWTQVMVYRTRYDLTRDTSASFWRSGFCLVPDRREVV
jgi:hypothetical protein